MFVSRLVTLDYYTLSSCSVTDSNLKCIHCPLEELDTSFTESNLTLIQKWLL